MMGRSILVPSLLFFVGACHVVGACHGGGAGDRPPPARQEAAKGVPLLGAQEGAVDGGAGALATLDVRMPRLTVVLDDPRLAAARQAERAHDPATAARDVDAVRAATGSLDPAAECAWDYVSGRLHLAAGEAAEAARAFERLLVPAEGGDAGAGCALASYAALRDAQALMRAGRASEALARVQTIRGELAEREETKLALADAYAGTGDRAAAVPIWRSLLEANPQGLRWVDTSLRLARALVDGVDGPPATRAGEALDLATRVLVEAPLVAEKLDVAQLRARAAAAMHKALPPLSPEAQARQARAWLEGRPSRPKRATQVADALLRALPKGDRTHVEAACDAAMVRARAVPRGRADETAGAWTLAIARCQGADELLPLALYYGAKASASALHRPDALARFAELERRFPAHRLADDARFREALVTLDEGDEGKYESLLASVPETYPDGDMKGEALFRLAIARLAVRDIDGARAVLSRLVGMTQNEAPSGRGWDAAGRAAYYLARAEQLAGDAEGAKRRYAAIVGERPLSFYMLLSYARLRAIDPAAAEDAVASALAREPRGSFPSREYPALSSPAFDRFTHLLEVGDDDAARREAAAGGLTGDGVDPEVVWTLAWMYERAGAVDMGVSMARGRLLDYRAHWPVGRWRLPWQVAFPRPWEALVASESAGSGIPTALTWAIMREESAFNPEARSVANAVGLMQLIAPTARLVARGTPFFSDDASLERPEVSIALGTRLLGSLRVSFSANPALAIAAYNGGAGAVRRWLSERGGDDFDVFVERIPFDETRAYLKHVLSSEAAYAYLYSPSALPELLALPGRAAGREVLASP